MIPEPNSVYRKSDCAAGDKAIKLLKEKGIDFEDHLLDPKEEEEIKNQFHVRTTPQIFLDGERIGGYSELSEKFDVKSEMEETSYVPVIAVFSVALLLALSTSFGFMGFMGFSLCLLALLKLMDIDSFKESFAKYDLITQNHPPYAKAYPFFELAVGLSFLSGFLINLAAALALLFGIIGTYSVYKAVYIDKKDLNCACIGGGSKAPLGAVSFSENAIMALMGLWILLT